MDVTQPATYVAFGAGLLSFFSPCVLPLVPGYLSLLVGLGAAPPGEGRAPRRRLLLLRALSFVLGFGLVFTALGLTASWVGQFFLDYGVWLERVGGVLLIVLGLHLAGWLELSFLQREQRLSLSASGGHWGALVFGASFAAGWSPCIGPVLASILLLAGGTGSVQAGGWLLLVYSAGLAVPFLLLALFFNELWSRLARVQQLLPWVYRVAGVILIGLGILLLSGQLARLTEYLTA